MSSGLEIHPVKDVRRQRIAISGIFLMVGIMLGSWFARVPQLRIELGLNFAELGMVLLSQTVGVLLAMQLAGHLSNHLDSRAVIRVTSLVLPWFLPLMAAMPGAVTAGLGMLTWGVIAGLLDVSMNAQGVEVERRARRPVLNSLHAVWGIGALLGSGGTVLAVRADLSLSAHFWVVSVVLVVIALFSGRWLLTESRAASPAAAEKAPKVGFFSGWTRAVIILGGLGAAVALCEGAVSSWGGVFLSEQRGAAANIASLGYFAFIVAQTGTRLIGDRLHRRFGAVALVRWSMAMTAAGVLLAVMVQSVWFGLAGLAMAGVGLAVAIPIISSAVGHGTKSNTSLAIARYSTLHNAGVLAGPAIFGWLAQTFGISMALTLLLVPLGIIGLFASATAPASVRSSSAPPEPGPEPVVPRAA
ncbi:MFS transporter [Amycolatopsis oliviviridis]|uniref:MFS transporter n=1 Tax=Amycolatopsis oliviviridis TaxID=1471590 RepID=A0ABQ3LLJ4_9PSEU|nr:MFS transporter [Amycolatopsis oliviviridis]GHH17886.1 MFS transporter [Amycolatopsis oliviviridis]